MNLTLDQQKLEIAACAASPAYFLSYTSILDPAHSKIIPFKLWPHQKMVLEMCQLHNLLDILKARQLGISWTLAGLGLWDVTFQEAATVLLLSKEESTAKDLLLKIKLMWESLPYWLRPTATVNNTTTLAFGALNSEIQALPSTETAGRSKTATRIICDEWAYHPYAETNYLAYQPTLAAGGRFVGSSTADGRGGFYYEMWKAAEEGSNGFHPLFLPWNLRPDRDQEWYEREKKKYSSTQQLRAKFLQEFPSTADEAFQAMEAAVFDKDVLDRLERECRAPIEVKDNLRIWKKPDPVKTYMVGVDPAAGQGKDRSGSTVIDYQTGEHVADLHGQIEPDDLARQTCLLGKDYNYALVGVERNNHGHTVLNVMRNYLGYPNLYRQMDVEDIGTKLGYLTTFDSKAMMVEEFKIALNRGDYLTHDAETIKELRTFCQYETQSKTGKPRIHYAAATGTFDDRVMKNMIGWQMRHYVVRTGFNQKAKYTVQGGV